ncbi:MAG TPA: FtsX-like permease family protein [Stellaceae bacterium]|nr:FtsX-like permease family protein [Stellaceae bacterium]
MSLLFKIAFRNILRNRRRSLMTGSAVAVGALAMLLFGAFQTFLFAGFQTNLVQHIGHLTLFRSGYFLYGAGNPAAYGIADYKGVMDLIAHDPALAPLVNVMTANQSLVGIAGNFDGENDAAKTFLGIGIVPSDRDRMRQWNEFGAGRVFAPDTRIADDDEGRGLVGGGLARILGLCAALSLENCPARPKTASADAPAATPAGAEVAELAARDAGAGGDDLHRGMPRIDLLSATAAGAPNVVSLAVSGIDPQGVKELDDNYVAMHLALAQQLVYGRGEHKVTGIVLQLHRSEDLPAARARLAALIAANKLDLEVRDFQELTPFYLQVIGLFRSIFLFIAVIMGVIVLFAVVNTMTMNVMERTNEIGTIRAMGLRRRGIRWQFIVEGALLGALGATAGLVLAVVVSYAVNAVGLTWLPPGNANPIPLRLEFAGALRLIIATWLGLVLIATLAALIPANRAARLPVVDALRHV